MTKFFQPPINTSFGCIKNRSLYRAVSLALASITSTSFAANISGFTLNGVNSPYTINAGDNVSGSIFVGGNSTLINNGTISMGVDDQWGYSLNLTNSGTITSSTQVYFYGGYGASRFLNVTNTGVIASKIYSRTQTVATIDNLQGAAINSPLIWQNDTRTWGGGEPAFTTMAYNIIVASPANYGQINFVSTSNANAAVTFGVSSLTSTNLGVAGTRYINAVTGLSASAIANEETVLSYSNSGKTATYKLTQGISATAWDLLVITSDFIGPFSVSDTQSSLTRLASRLRSSYNSASLISNFANSNTYDCNLFDVKGMCISAGGRYSTVDNPSSNSTAAVVTLGYKVNPNIRIGGFLDQSINNNNPTGVHLSNSNPMMGAFAYWNQNADGLGYQVKIANAYQDKDLSTTRDVIGTSEAGMGKTSLTTQSYVGELSYAFMFKENTLVRPYFALRHTSIEQDAYTETGVTTPLTYSALNDRTTSALMGVKFKHALTPKTNLTGSLGVEQDLHHKTDQLTASGVSGLTSESFSGNIHRTRPVASLGASYDIAKTQRLSGEVLVQQLPFQSTTGATAYFNYMIGF